MAMLRTEKQKKELDRRLAHALLGFQENPEPLAPEVEVVEESLLTPWQQEQITRWESDCYSFLTAKDEDDYPLLWTKDERDKDTPIKHFPQDKPYLAEIVKAFENEPYIFADKSRQMMLTYSAVLYANWDCMFHPGRLWLLSKNNDEEANTILEDKVRFPWRSLPAWLQDYAPMTLKPADIIRYPATGSKFIAVGQNVDTAEARGSTISGIIVDEAAFQDHFPTIWQAIVPMAQQIIAITTPNIGTPGADFFYEMLERED